jgi:hypothetical protein
MEMGDPNSPGGQETPESNKKCSNLSTIAALTAEKNSMELLSLKQF